MTPTHHHRIVFIPVLHVQPAVIYPCPSLLQVTINETHYYRIYFIAEYVRANVIRLSCFLGTLTTFGGFGEVTFFFSSILPRCASYAL